MDPTAVLSQLKVKRGDLTNQETSLVHQIDEATRQLADVRQTRDKVDESIAQFNNILSMIAQQWALPLGTSSVPVVIPAATEPAPAQAQAQAEAPKKSSKKASATTKTVVVQEPPVPAPAPVPVSAPVPAPGPVPVVVSKEEAEPTQEEETKESTEGEGEGDEEGEGDVEVLEITQDGVTYVVFTDTNDVAEADDPDENIVGSWDPVSKKIVFA
jgi:hypothetical protein